MQRAILNRTISTIATDAKGAIRIFSVGAEHMLGFTAEEAIDRLAPTALFDPQELAARADAIAVEIGRPLTSTFEALVHHAASGIEDVYELTCVRKDGRRFPAVVSVTSLREHGVTIGYQLITRDNTEHKTADAALLAAGALQNAIFNSANFSSIATDAKGVIQIFNVGAERMLGYAAVDVMNKITPADISDPQEILARAASLSVELGTPITPGFEALIFKASRGIEDIYELTYIRKDGSRFPAVVSVTALRDMQDAIIGYLLIGTDNTARKQAEEALLKAGALQRAIFNSANFSSIATDAKGVIQIFNVGAERMLGYAAVDVMNKITPADISDPQEILARAASLSVELGTPITPGFDALVFKASRGIEDIYELTYIRKDGSRFPAVVSVTALRDMEDAIIGYLLIGTDNTARKQAEEALLKAGALQRAIFNSANFSSIATDAKGVIQIFNVGAERMLGYAAVDVMNKVTPADISDPQEVVARAESLSLELGTPITPGFDALVFKASRGIEDIYELTYIRKDGSRFPAVVSVTALRDMEDAIIGYLLIGTDNTARKQAEEALLKAGALQRAIFNSANFSSIATDAKGVIQIFNVGAERMLGYAAVDVMNKVTPADISDPQEVVARAESLSLELGTPITPGFDALVFKASRGIEDIYELTYIRKDGSRFPAVVSVTALRDAQDAIIGYLLIGTDNTARKQIEEERQRLEQALQLKNIELVASSRMKSEFLANMSHELRTPLNAIIGFSEVLKDGLIGQMTDQQRRFIGDIFGSGNHLLALINDILDLSKVEAGKMTLELEPIDVSSLFANSLSIIREKALARQIRLTLDAVDTLGSIPVDARKVKQIVYNLLSNAVKFTRTGGQVTLRATRVARDKAGQMSASKASRSFPLADSEFDEFLEIRVTDNGIGISDGGLERLFKPFSQIDSGLARQFEGTGLGLAMVKSLAELHGGTVAVESSHGEGACFAVWLPIREPVADTVAPIKRVQAPTAAVMTGERVALVVEGDFNSANLIRLQLELEGFTVLHAVSAEAGLAVAVQQPLSLITLDILLPNMDGWEFLNRIKQVPELQRVPVVIISIAADSNRGFALGAAAVMQKPISRRELYDALVDLGVCPRGQDETLSVLVVDDDRRSVEIVAAGIAGLATTVLLAYGGQEGINLARREHPDVIVLDLMMPEVSGFDVVEALREQPDTARIPILVVTAKEITTEDRAKLSGCVAAILEKAEFNGARFAAEVGRAMSGRRVAA